MVKFLVILVGAFGVNLFITDCSTSYLPEGNEWELIENSSDEFIGDDLNNNKWNKYLWYDSSGVLGFNQSNVFIKNGLLNLEADKFENNDSAWSIGAVESVFDVPGQTSFIEIRAKLLPYKANVLSAIWLQSWPSVQNNPNPEIDVHEYFFEKTISMNLHEWSKKSDGTYDHIDYGGRHFQYDEILSDNFHLWGLERINGRIRFYFDGIMLEEWIVPDCSFVNLPRHIVLSLEGHNGIPDNRFLPAVFQIDYVRTYKSE